MINFQLLNRIPEVIKRRYWLNSYYQILHCLTRKHLVASKRKEQRPNNSTRQLIQNGQLVSLRKAWTPAARTCQRLMAFLGLKQWTYRICLMQNNGVRAQKNRQSVVSTQQGLQLARNQNKWMVNIWMPPERPRTPSSSLTPRLGCVIRAQVDKRKELRSQLQISKKNAASR